MSDQKLSWKDQVVIITGAGGGLGRSYALFFASRGAKVLVNDFAKANADKVVAEIKSNGGEALANYDSAAEGEKVVKQAVDAWGRVDVLINNAGFLRDKSFKKMSDKEWNDIHEVHVRAAFALSKAVWPIMRKQKYGRIINTSSAAGIYGNMGQANYSSAKFALVGFSKTLAIEGKKYGINVNAIAPVAASQMTATIMPKEMLDNLSPDKVTPLVAYLTHKDTQVSGKLYELGAGWYGQIRWQRGKGAVFKADKTFTPGAVKERWQEVNQFEEGWEMPELMVSADYGALLEKARSQASNKVSSEISYKGQTVLITGAGAGLGRAYALMFARGGANVVINDMSEKSANEVKSEVESIGAKAAIVIGSTEDGEKLVKAAVDAFGGLHAIVCNAGILRDKSFAALQPAEWDMVYAVHLRGTYAVAKAAWPIFQEQKYGRIVTTSSTVGLHGNFGQANYSSAKSGIIGLTKTLAIEGAKYNILANVMVPNAGTAMTRTIWPEEMVQAFSPDYIAPVVGYLSSKDNTKTAGIYEVSGGWVAPYQWIRSKGVAFPLNKQVTVEDIKSKWDEITKFDENATHPSAVSESLEDIIGNFSNTGSEDSLDSKDWSDPEDSKIVADAKKLVGKADFVFTERDIALYNLGVGAKADQLDLVFEGADGFKPLPTFGVVVGFEAMFAVPLDWLPNFDFRKLLHGEQYLKIHAEPPTSGTLETTARVMEVLDKGKAASVAIIHTTKDKATGELVYENQSILFVRGSGGFGGRKTGSDRDEATALNAAPKRKPDAIVEEKTTLEQAALYRLSGDVNPLHVDPTFAKGGGFDKPILHGLCFMGFAAKHVLQTYGPIGEVKVRFAGSVYPGETLVTELWKEGNKVFFQTKTKGRGNVVISNAAAKLL